MKSDTAFDTRFCYSSANENFFMDTISFACGKNSFSHLFTLLLFLEKSHCKKIYNMAELIATAYLLGNNNFTFKNTIL
jgi:hypothetical protein